jgi:hypothetical protein
MLDDLGILTVGRPHLDYRPMVLSELEATFSSPRVWYD